MKLSLDTDSSAYVIRAYRRGELVINEQTVTRSVVVLPQRLIGDWPPQRFEELAMEHVETVVALAPEIILLGTGGRARLPSARLAAAVLRRDIGLEAMDTAAACRTFNVLASEGRRVAAALMMI
ncbi:MAG: Xcc1710-like domain-containing protein [Gammaproteobacteria bacterium]|nr:Xcc1710-like domain-containing protein [Gammaproteobacteria bacterium]NIR32893.1 Xcc1710-like domain-containing protein [Gammaproteobacteria bacterium]NIR99439.1 Xcc1710-like domain-containing protein [Gammaproteobacteria bacterium]NIT65053.1 Xcc1710-like domain-containing protein [Gammaproteobacteria bacterium]NIV21968.1 hypothetical protein [Gammaproteobacteria bacterium]